MRPWDTQDFSSLNWNLPSLNVCCWNISVVTRLMQTLHKYFINSQDQPQIFCCIRLMAKRSKMLRVHFENWPNSLGFQVQLGSADSYPTCTQLTDQQHWMPTQSPYRLCHWLMVNLARSSPSSHCILLSRGFLKKDGARISERKKNQKILWVCHCKTLFKWGLLFLHTALHMVCTRTSYQHCKHPT